MKKVSVLFISALALGMVFTSCSNDGGAGASIEGKWNLNKSSYTSGGITSPEEDYEGNEAGCNKDFIEFGAAGVYNAGDYVTDCELESFTGTWSKSGNTLTVIVDGETETSEIVSVIGSDLRVKITFTEFGTTYTYNLSFTKE